MGAKEIVKSVAKSVGISTNPEYFISDSNLNLLKACVSGNNAALLIGETGTGKTTILRELAKEHKKELVRISVNGSMGVEEILGKWLVNSGTTVWQDGLLTMALRKGHWVVMDEINAALPEILFVLHSLLDDDRKIYLAEKDNEIVRPHAEFRFFAGMNPSEEYAGTKDMNKALISRFAAVLNVDVLDQVGEVKLLMKKGASTEHATNLVNLATKLRQYKAKDMIFYFCSTRDLVQADELVRAGLSFGDAVTGAIANKMTKKEFEIVKNDFKSYITLAPQVGVLSIENIITLANNYDRDIKSAREECDKKLKLMTTELTEARRASADQVTYALLNKLKNIAEK